jgi:hypothetical protein
MKEETKKVKTKSKRKETIKTRRTNDGGKRKPRNVKKEKDKMKKGSNDEIDRQREKKKERKRNKFTLPGVKRPEREADHLPPFSAKVKNMWSYTSTPQYFFMAWCLVKHRNEFTFTFTFY